MRRRCRGALGSPWTGRGATGLARKARLERNVRRHLAMAVAQPRGLQRSCPGLRVTAMLVQLRQQARRLTSSRFVRNVAAVATGIAAAQAISLAFMPFLTRLYGPEAFGALAAFTAVVNIITPLATLGYANAIVMPDTEEGASAVARLSLLFAAIGAPVVLVFVFLFQLRL